jgi:hypothetical protein
MSALEWTRTLAAAEISFASDIQGAGVEWSTVSGISDAEGIALLRQLQRKLGRIVLPTIGRGFGSRPAKQMVDGVVVPKGE